MSWALQMSLASSDNWLAQLGLALRSRSGLGMEGQLMSQHMSMKLGTHSRTRKRLEGSKLFTLADLL